MDCWSILEIKFTKDMTTIKRAYAKQLRKYHPEENPEGFQRVREAYEVAIKSANELKKSTPMMKQQGSNADIEGKVIIREAYMPIDNLKKVINEIEFMDKVKALYNNPSVRNDRDQWKDLLNELTFYTIDTSEKIYCLLSDFLQENHKISFNILILLNEYFRWTEQPEELVDIFYKEEELVDLAKSEKDVVITRRTIRILYNEAEYLRTRLWVSPQALHIYEQILEIAKINIDPDIDKFAVYTLYHRANIFRKTGKDDCAIADYDMLIHYYESWEDREVKPIIADAFFKRAVLLTEKGEKNEAIYAYSKLISKYLGDTDKQITHIVVNAQYNKAMCLRFLGKHKESFKTLKDLIDTYSFYKDKEIKELVKKAKVDMKDQVKNNPVINVGIFSLIFIFMVATCGFKAAVIHEVLLIIGIAMKKGYEKYKI